jgi:Trypsin-like peptidase domain
MSSALFLASGSIACRRLAVAMTMAVAGLLSACGGGGDAGPPSTSGSASTANGTAGTSVNAPSSASGTASGTANGASAAGATAGSGGTTAPSGSNLDSSSYVVVVKTDRRSPFAFGTAFAIGDRMLATNSHVTQGVLEFAQAAARSGERVIGVSAFQSETGREFPLLEAIVHPSYTGTNSPDVGLLVARDSLPSQLPLATPEETATVRKGDTLQLNGFPGNVFQQTFGDSFQPGFSVPQASLFVGNVQAVRAFDERIVVDPANINTVERFEYSMDTSAGTSGSPVLRNGKVVAVHNSGLQLDVFVVENGQTVVKAQVPVGTASGGIHVKHLHNLIQEYKTGVLEADKRFRLPPPASLLQGGGQTVAEASANQIFQGNVVLAGNPNATHQVRVVVDQNLRVTGISQWPANPALGLPARQFTLSGRVLPNGKIEFADNTPELVAGFRRGVYLGNVSAGSGQMSGQYYEINESTNELYYFGDWAGRR